MGRKFLTEAEVTEVFNIPTPTLRNRRHLRLGPPYHKLGRKILYSLDTLNKWFADQEHSPEGERGLKL